MIQFTKWIILAIVFTLLIAYDLTHLNINQHFIIALYSVLNAMIMILVSIFLNWNIKSDEDLGIKPGIELF